MCSLYQGHTGLCSNFWCMYWTRRNMFTAENRQNGEGKMRKDTYDQSLFTAEWLVSECAQDFESYPIPSASPYFLPFCFLSPVLSPLRPLFSLSGHLSSHLPSQQVGKMPLWQCLVSNPGLHGFLPSYTKEKTAFAFYWRRADSPSSG